MPTIDFNKHLDAANSLPKELLLIGGKASNAGSAGMFEHVNPATGCKQAEVALGGAPEIDAAVRAARAAFDPWRKTKPARRGELLFKLAQLVEEQRDELALLSALENGMPYYQYSAMQTPIISGWLRYYAGYADKLEGHVVASWPSEHLEYTIPEAIGVIGCIIPWNAPMISIVMKLAPLLAAGCTTVVKPAEFTPFTAIKFAQLALQAGIPEGVINIVPGQAAAGDALVRHPDVDKISFTGGTIAARRVMAACSETLKPALYELGGKSANIVFEDADFQKAVPYCAFFAVSNSGQGCQLPTRLLVQDSIYDGFVEQVVGTMQHVKVGDPFDPETYMGPVVSAAAVTRITGDIETARRENAGTLACGGGRLEGDGFFIAPTVFTDVKIDSKLAQNEIFGPVLSVFRFKDEADAIRIANSTPWGLAGYVQTRDLGRAHRMAAELRCGNVMINASPNVHPAAPFGGVGLSGHGKEGGRWGIEEFIRQKSVGVNW